MEVSTEHRPMELSELADLTRCCASKEERLTRAEGILSASLENMALQRAFERQIDIDELEILHSIMFQFCSGHVSA